MTETQREPVPRTDTGELDTALAFLGFARGCVLKARSLAAVATGVGLPHRRRAVVLAVGPERLAGLPVGHLGRPEASDLRLLSPDAGRRLLRAGRGDRVPHRAPDQRTSVADGPCWGLTTAPGPAEVAGAHHGRRALVAGVDLGDDRDRGARCPAAADVGAGLARLPPTVDVEDLLDLGAAGEHRRRHGTRPDRVGGRVVHPAGAEHRVLGGADQVGGRAGQLGRPVGDRHVQHRAARGPQQERLDADLAGRVVEPVARRAARRHPARRTRGGRGARRSAGRACRGSGSPGR